MFRSFSVVDALAIVAGLTAIVAINWYFFLAERGSASATTTAAGGMAEVAIAVHGGYEPSTVRVKAGTPVRLIFERQETNSCSEEVVLPDFGIRRFLPAFQKTAIEITPARPGTYEFTCGMSMLRGKVVAE